MASGASTISKSLPGISPRVAKYALLGLSLLATMLWFSSRWLLAANFLPHWYCYVGNQRLLWTNVIADLLIGSSYVAISATLLWLIGRVGQDLPFPGFFWAFGVFIVSCGGTHFLEVLTVWKPVYWLAATMKIVTAAASAGTAAILLFAAGDIVYLIRMMRTAAARRGDERFRALIHAAPMAVVSADLDGMVTAWNPAAEAIFGWPVEEVIGNPFPSVPHEKTEEYTELFHKTVAGKVTAGLETIRIDRQGQRFPVSVSAAPVHDEHGSLSGYMSVIEDISERKRIELELQEKTAVLATVTQALNTFLDKGDWSAASKHLLAFAIRQTQSEYGFLGVVLDGPVLRVLAHEGATWDLHLNREMYEEKMRQHATQGYFEVAHAHNFLAEVIHKGETIVVNSPETDPRSGGLPAGHPRMESFLGVPIFKGHETVGLIGVANRPGGYTGKELLSLETMSQATGVLYDNYRQHLKRTALEEEQKRLESQVRQAQKMEVLGRLAGGVAHDFNNMLMVLGASAELLKPSLPKGTRAGTYLEQIQRTTEKAASITKQLLAFSRKQVLDVRPMDLHEALRNSEFMLSRLLGPDIELAFHHQAAQSWILSDPAQIEQVVANLAINARDAMPDGGRLSISTRDAAHLPEESAQAVSPAKCWVVLEVADSGCGMDEKTRAQIFEPFFTTKPPGKGTGLGLSTVYGIVKQSAGHIRMQSALREGTRFDLYFRATEPQPLTPQNEPAARSAKESANAATVLVADDEGLLRQSVVEFLRNSGYTLLEACTSLEALEIAEKYSGKIDVLLTDILMPGFRGPELARRVAAIHPEIRVVYMSGYAEGLPEAQLPPEAVFLQKPFRFATLLEQLKLVLRKA